MATKTYLLRLESIVPNGVGGPEAEKIGIIYSVLLQEFKLDFYSNININQVGQDLDEFVMKEGQKKVHINIRYPANKDVATKLPVEKNKIRLNIIHAALLMLAEEDARIELEKLEAIKQQILDANFCFEIVFKTFANKKKSNLTAKITINPIEDKFEIYVVVEDSGIRKCKILIYSGKPTDYYFRSFFSNATWKGLNEFIINPKKDFEIRVFIDKCTYELVNHTNYTNPPRFQMFKANLSPAEKDKAYKDWVDSMPLHIAAIVTQEPN